MNIEREDDTGQDDWDKRLLCSDGNCIGIIGPDGRCKECGQSYEGTLPANWQATGEADRPVGADGAANTDAETLPDDTRQTVSSESGTVATAPIENEQDAQIGGVDDEGGAAPDYWQQRRLCPDGNCIGVIGHDGRCKECGKPYE
jgi:hypothetical protein